MKKFRCYFFCILSFLLFSPQILSASNSKVDIFIGVLAKRSPEQCLQQWQPLAEYLNKNVTGSNFIIVPLGFKKIDTAVAEKSVDFVLSNPAIYVNLEKKFRVTRIVTMENRLLGAHSSQFGGVLFTKSNRRDIRTVANLKGKDFMAVSPTSFGGWLTSWRYLEKKGIDPHSHFKKFDFGYSHDAVVRAVQQEKVDAGAIRSGILELMALEGKIDLQDFYVIDDKRDSTNSAFMHTTRLYPEWAFAMPDPAVSVAEVAAIIEQDMAMVAKVLQLVNSAFFGLFQKVESPTRAVNLWVLKQ